MTTIARPHLTSRAALAPAILTLSLCVASPYMLVGLLGGLPLESRNSWSVSLVLWFLIVVPTLTLVVTAFRNRGGEWRVLGPAILVTGLLMRLPYFAGGSLFEDDHFRYLLDGAVLASGNNPYRFAPADLSAQPGLAALALSEQGRSVVSQINFPDLRTIYPGTAQILFALSHLLDPWSLNGLRFIACASEAISAFLLWRTIATQQLSPWRVAVVWCNPLLAFTLTGQAHIDAVIMPLILASLLAARQQSAGLAGLAIGFAVGVKLWPALLVPIIARVFIGHVKLLMAYLAMAAVTSAVLCVPLVMSSVTPQSGLAAYAGGWAINNAPYAWAAFLAGSLGGPGAVIGLRMIIALTAVASALWFALRPVENFQSLLVSLCAVSAAAFYLSPAQFPWYAAWFLPLAAACGCWPLIAASVLLPTYYFFFALAASGLRDAFIYGVAALHLLPVAVVALLTQRGRPLS